MRSRMPAVAGDERARVLGAGGALEHRLREVARLRREPQQRPEDQGLDGVLPQSIEHDRDDDRGRDQPADQPGVRLGRRDVGQELRPSELPADEIRTRVVRPDPQDEQQDPPALSVQEPAEGRCRRDGRGTGAEPDDEREQAHVQGAEDGRHPRDQPIARIGPRERADGDEDHADGEEQQAASLAGSPGDPRPARGRPRGPRRATAGSGSPRSASGGRPPRRPGPRPRRRPPGWPARR